MKLLTLKTLSCSRGHSYDPLIQDLPSSDGRLVCPKCNEVLRTLVPIDRAKAESAREMRMVIPSLLVAFLSFPTVVLLIWLSVSRWRVHEVVVSPDNKLLAVARGTVDGNRVVELWDIEKQERRAIVGGEGQQIFGDRGEKFSSPRFGGDGILYLLRDRRLDVREEGKIARTVSDVCQWDYHKNVENAKVTDLVSHTARARTMGGAAAGQKFLVTDYDGMVSLLDVEKKSATPLTEAKTTQCATWNERGDLAFTGGLDGSITFWETTPPVRLHQIAAHRGLVKMLAIDEKGQKLASVGGLDRTLCLFDLTTRNEIWRHVSDLDWLTNVVFAPGGRVLALAGGAFQGRGTVQVWDIASQSLIARFTVDTNTVTCMVFSADGKSLFAGSGIATSIAQWQSQGKVHVWDISTQTEKWRFP